MPSTGEISGPGGIEHADPKVMAVLVALARSPGRLVTRAELLDEIWPGGVIYDENLTQSIYQLRQHLSAAGGDPSFRKLIGTFPKRGYVLKGDVAHAGAKPAGGPPSTDHVSGVPRGRQRRVRLWIVAGFVTMVLAAVWSGIDSERSKAPDTSPRASAAGPALVVLPFRNASGDAADDYLSDGVGDMLRDRLGMTGKLRVVARRSSDALRGSTGNTAEIGRQLRVERMVEGRFLRDRDDIEVSVELVDPASGFQLWSRTYRRRAQELMLLQDKMANDLIAELIPSYTPPAPIRSPTPKEFTAYDYVLLARRYDQQLTDEQVVNTELLAKTISLYRDAIEADPLSAEAHARLGRALLYSGEVTRAEPHILKALEIDPTRSDAFTALGLYYWSVRESGIGAAYNKAIALNPSDADAMGYLASWSWLQGDAQAAVDLYRAALEIDPLSLLRYGELGYKLAFQGSRREALEVEDRLLELFPTAPGYLAAARIREALGDLDVASAHALQALQYRPGDPEASGLLAELLARLDDFDAARRYEPEPGIGYLFWQRRYEELVELGQDLMFDEEAYQPDAGFLVAFAESALGDPAAAVAELEAAGLPGTAQSESRRASEIQAMNTYAGALDAIGRHTDALAVANWLLEFNGSLMAVEGAGGWLPRLSTACALSVLGRNDEAIGWIRTLPEIKTLTWLPMLQDLACFDGLVDEPAYRAALEALQARIAALRNKLPGTLEQRGLRLN